LASAWGGSGPAPLRPAPPSLFVASGSMATAGASPTKSEREPPFGFVREELARFSLESRGSSKGSGARSSRDAVDGRRLQSHLQLRSSSSSSSSSSRSSRSSRRRRSSDHSRDSEDSLQAGRSASGHAPHSNADAIMAQGSDSEVHPPLHQRKSFQNGNQLSTRRSFSFSRVQFDRLSGRPHRLSAAAVPAALPLTKKHRFAQRIRVVSAQRLGNMMTARIRGGSSDAECFHEHHFHHRYHHQQHNGAINLTSDSPNRNAQFGGMQRELQLIVNVADTATQDLMPYKAIHTLSTHMFASKSVREKILGGTGSGFTSSDRMQNKNKTVRRSRYATVSVRAVAAATYWRLACLVEKVADVSARKRGGL
jgi:hypothetical protein